jgi:hypothetical protein
MAAAMNGGIGKRERFRIRLKDCVFFTLANPQTLPGLGSNIAQCFTQF